MGISEGETGLVGSEGSIPENVHDADAAVPQRGGDHSRATATIGRLLGTEQRRSIDPGELDELVDGGFEDAGPDGWNDGVTRGLGRMVAERGAHPSVSKTRFAGRRLRAAAVPFGRFVGWVESHVDDELDVGEGEFPLDVGETAGAVADGPEGDFRERPPQAMGAVPAVSAKAGQISR